MQGNSYGPTESVVLFSDEGTTGIASIKLIMEKKKLFEEGKLVPVNWDRKKVQAEILAVNGKLHSIYW